MAYAHGGYTCDDCGGHIGARCEPTGRMFPAASVVTDGMWYNGRFLCSKCRDKERDKIAAYLMVKFPGDTGQDKLARVLEGTRAYGKSSEDFLPRRETGVECQEQILLRNPQRTEGKGVPETHAVLDEADRGEDVRYR